MSQTNDQITEQIKNRRTFAIISHPDAGKTTLTEKFLLYGGAINLAGTVKGRKAAKHAVSDWITIDGKNIDLSYKEFELLAYFMENKGIALSREKILNHVWNYDYFGDARTIDTHVKKLRSKMGEKGDYIKTIWGMGYKLDIDAPQ